MLRPNTKAVLVIAEIPMYVSVNFRYQLEPGVYGWLEAKCPHCGRVDQLEQRRVSGVVHGFKTSSGVVYECPVCRGHARPLGLIARGFWTLVLAVVLALVIGMPVLLGSFLIGSIASGDGVPPLDAWLPMVVAMGLSGYLI